MKIDWKNKRLIYKDGTWIKWCIARKKKLIVQTKHEIITTQTIVNYLEDKIDTMQRILDDYKKSRIDVGSFINESYIKPKFGRSGRLCISTYLADDGTTSKRYTVIFSDHEEPEMIDVDIKGELLK